MILVLPCIIFALIAQSMVKSRFAAYSKVATIRSITGAEAARKILDANHLTNIAIERVAGNLTDHYDPSKNVIRLSDGVYSSSSVAAVGVAAHETGHAVQHAEGYVPIKWRTALVPIANIGSSLSVPLIIIGFVLMRLQSALGEFGLMAAWAGVALFGLAVLFQLVTLPCEFDASRRAINALSNSGCLDEREVPMVKSVLGAAALTYIAAAATSIAQLLRFILIIGGRRRD
ncbi:MAG: zinc metallopeptidase [Clostridia bacterium]|nr:zinc metallopeptidase [Clostridia bacterium]